MSPIPTNRSLRLIRLVLPTITQRQSLGLVIRRRTHQDGRSSRNSQPETASLLLRMMTELLTHLHKAEALPQVPTTKRLAADRFMHRFQLRPRLLIRTPFTTPHKALPRPSSLAATMV